MALAKTRRRLLENSFWPGFVDAMATLLLVIIFLLSVFMLAQFFLSQEISGKDTVLNRLNNQISELTELLALERASRRDLEESISLLQANLDNTEAERSELLGLLEAQTDSSSSAENQVSELQTSLDEERRVTQRALLQVELLNQQIAALRRQLVSLEAALEVSEKRDADSQAKIADLGRRLNVALAQRVQELSRYRSDFFGRLREILSKRSDIRVVGDRFVFQSEVFFSSGSDEINPQGQEEIYKLADAIIELERQIPEEINWVLRVDGHTDVNPLSGTGRLRNNWDLSSARAISVVQNLIFLGVSPHRLVAAGFGEYQPLEAGDSEEIHAKNRRIELKLTER